MNEWMDGWIASVLVCSAVSHDRLWDEAFFILFNFCSNNDDNNNNNKHLESGV